MFESPDVTLLDFCLWCRMKDGFLRRKVDARDEFLARILGAAASIETCRSTRKNNTRSSYTNRKVH
jgi:hypothetical protein